jgi:uncharacterized protein YifN (PemK superfamily)
MPRFYDSLIVDASIADGNGSTKNRPAVVIKGGKDCDVTGEILVVPISSSDDGDIPENVLVNSTSEIDPVTGLVSRCWAKCDWAQWIDIRRVTGKRGDMPDGLMTSIVDTCRDIYADGEI